MATTALKTSTGDRTVSVYSQNGGRIWLEVDKANEPGSTCLALTADEADMIGRALTSQALFAQVEHEMALQGLLDNG